MEIKDLIEFKAITLFIEDYMSKYDLSNLSYIKLVPNSRPNKRAIRGTSFVNLSKRIPSTWSNSDNTSRSKIRIQIETNKEYYPIVHDDWIRHPTTETIQGWITRAAQWRFDSPEQALIWAFGRYTFRWLSKTRQIKENGNHVKDVHANATWFADQMLVEYRNYRTNIILNTDGR